MCAELRAATHFRARFFFIRFIAAIEASGLSTHPIDSFGRKGVPPGDRDIFVLRKAMPDMCFLKASVPESDDFVSFFLRGRRVLRPFLILLRMSTEIPRGLDDETRTFSGTRFFWRRFFNFERIDARILGVTFMGPVPSVFLLMGAAFRGRRPRFFTFALIDCNAEVVKNPLLPDG